MLVEQVSGRGFGFSDAGRGRCALNRRTRSQKCLARGLSTNDATSATDRPSDRTFRGTRRLPRCLWL